MGSFLKNHPFAVEAFFESSVVLTFAVPKEDLQRLIPACLQLDTFNDQWAFVAVAMVQTKSLRPKGLPAVMGSDFLLIGYRIFVRYVNRAGKRLRGLYILKSETDSWQMNVLGNLLTSYSYTTTDIVQTRTGPQRTILSEKSGLRIHIETGTEDIPLPVSSPFKDWKEARRFAGPLPFTFSYDAGRHEVLIIEGVRQHWEPAPVRVISHELPFLSTLDLHDPQLANAFMVVQIPYHWKKGRIEKWPH
jgi:hypothetical protein